MRPQEIHPFFENTPTSNLIQIVDAPIRTAGSNSNKSVKILVCNTQHPNLNTHSEKLEEESKYSARFKQLIDIMKLVKEGDDAPDIYTFSKVHPAMLVHIKQCFSLEAYRILEKPYASSQEKISLVTVLHKKTLKNVTLFPFLVHRIVREFQSILCMFEGKYSFLLHAADLQCQDYDISESEKKILNNIFSDRVFSQYPQILTGNLNITLQVQDEATRNIATSVVPESMRNKQPSLLKDQNGCSWGRALGTLTCPVVTQGRYTPVQLSDVEVETHRLINPKTGEIYQEPRAVPSKGPREIRLLSRFGKPYRGLSRILSEELNNFSKLEQIFNQQTGSVKIYIACDQFNASPATVFKIPKVIWKDLKVSFNRENVQVTENKSGAYLVYPDIDARKNIKMAMKIFTDGMYANVRSLEKKVSGLICEYPKTNHLEYCKFSFQGHGPLILQYLQQIFPTGEVVSGNKFKMPASLIDKKTGKQFNILKEIAVNLERVNRNCDGLVTVDFLYQNKDELSIFCIKIEFFNENIYNHILEIIKRHEGYRESFLNNATQSLIIPHTDFFQTQSDSNPSLLKTLENAVATMVACLPYGIKRSRTVNNAIYSESLLPYALIQRFQFTKGKKVINSAFHYGLASGKSYADVADALFQDSFTLMGALIGEFNQYKGEDQAYIDLKAISKTKGSDSLVVFQEIVEHCDNKMEDSENESNSFALFRILAIDNQTSLLLRSIAEFKTNVEFNCQAKDRIQTLQQLINTQEKRELVKLCRKEREGDGGEPYNKFRKNSALLLLEQHLILSHPEYTSNDVWEHIKAEPVEYYGTGKNYKNKLDENLKLTDILEDLSSIVTFIKSLTTSNDVTTLANETLNK